MFSKFLPTKDRVRHFGLETAFAGALALGVATVAYAALPNVAKPVSLPAVVEAPAENAAPPAPPPVFECGNPVPGEKINSPFGLRRLPWEDHGRLHEGVDIAGPTGTRVVAVSDGIVTRSGESPSYGRYVEVEHGVGLTSFYSHLGKIERGVKKGRYIEAGRTVGRMGSTGTSTGPHVHFEIRQDGKPLNPLVFIGREFATKEDLPIKLGEYVSPRVRLATVSEIPESKKALMEAKAGKGKKSKKFRKGKKVRETLTFAANS